MTVQQLLRQYGVYVKEDIDAAWDKYVNNAENGDQAEENAAYLDFLGYWFSLKKSKDEAVAKRNETALDHMLSMLNAKADKDGEPVTVSKTGKTRRKAVEAALNRVMFKLYFDFPTAIELTALANGKYECTLTCDIFYSEKAGEAAMYFVEEDRFTLPWLSIVYAAKCRNLQAYFKIGNNLNRALEYIPYFSFSSIKAEAKYTDKTTTFTISPRSALYWYYLGAEDGGIECRYQAAKLFLAEKGYPLYAKYMYELSMLESKHRGEAELATVETLAAHDNIHPSVISASGKQALLTRLVKQYASAPPQTISQRALRLLADHAYEQKAYTEALSLYRRSGATSASAANSRVLAEKMGTLLYDAGEREAALEWLEWLYDHPLYTLTGNNLPAFGQSRRRADEASKIGGIYLELWQKNRDRQYAEKAASYFETGTPTPQQASTLLYLHVQKEITLSVVRLQRYAESALPQLDASTAYEVSCQLWQADKKAHRRLCIALMRQSLDVDDTAGRVWRYLGYMIGYDTLYGEGFSAEQLEEAKNCFERSRECGFINANLQLSDCYWSSQKEGFPQDYPAAKALLQELLEKGNAELQYSAHLRLARIGQLEKAPIAECVEHLAQAYRLNTKKDAAATFHKRYGEWLNGYVTTLLQEGTLRQELQPLFGDHPDFAYAVALQQEQSGNRRTAIALYGCSAAWGSKKALCNLYNMAKKDTDYFEAREKQV